MRLWIACLLSACGIAAAAPVHASFDIAATGGWHAVSGTAVVDNSVRHLQHPALLLDGDGVHESVVYSSLVSLTIGQRYILSGWIRTEDLRVRDRDRSPVV